MVLLFALLLLSLQLESAGSVVFDMAGPGVSTTESLPARATVVAVDVFSDVRPHMALEVRHAVPEALLARWAGVVLGVRGGTGEPLVDGRYHLGVGNLQVARRGRNAPARGGLDALRGALLGQWPCGGGRAPALLRRGGPREGDDGLRLRLRNVVAIHVAVVGDALGVDIERGGRGRGQVVQRALG